MIRTVRVPAASAVSRAAKSSGSFFSKPLEFADRCLDYAYPAPPFASLGAPETGRRPKSPLSAPYVAPTPLESATTPPLHRRAPGQPMAAGTPFPIVRSSMFAVAHPNSDVCRCRRRAAAGNRTGVAGRLIVQRLSSAPSAQGKCSTQPAATPPRPAETP